VLLALLACLPLLALLALLAWLTLRATFALRLAATRLTRRLTRWLARVIFSGAFGAAVLGARSSHRPRTAHTASLVFIVC
jgi:type II secretory pathway component PulJ